MQQNAPNYIKLAIQAAGGRKPVAEMFGVSTWTVTHWTRCGWLPAVHIRRLCEAGGVISADQILGQIERRHAEAEKAAA